MVERNKLYLLCGDHTLEETYAVLREFWETFLRIHPTYIAALLFADGVDSSRCIPVYIHIDEGRGSLHVD